jgi:protein-L-isoaspartate(D-aspartate) O-methyltransferase
MELVNCRRFYADDIRVLAEVRSLTLVEAFALVPRENFFGPPPWQIATPDRTALAFAGFVRSIYVTTSDPRDLYHNVLIAIDAARFINNGQPTLLAHWTDELDLKPGDRVFHVGCGVGYYTAIMAETVGPQGNVVAAEVDPAIAARAKENLARYPQVTLHSGDGAALDPGECDAMLINAGVTHPHRPWLDRLTEGGRLVLPLTAAAAGTPGGVGVSAKIVRRGNTFSAHLLGPVAIYSCTSVRDPQLEPALQKALATKTLLKLKSVRIDSHEPADTCLVHSGAVCLSAREQEP